MRKLTMIGLAITAVFALSALAASAASAAPSYSCGPAGAHTCDFTAIQESNQVFKAGATVTCTGVTGEGSFANGATSIETSKIEYTGCNVAGQAATVAMNGCNYTFDQATGTGSPYGIPTIAIKCPEGKTIVVKATTSGCTITVGSQTLTGGSSTAEDITTTSPAEVVLNAKLGGITSTSSGGVCGPKGTTSTASYEGKVTIKAFDELGGKGTATPISVTP